MEKDIITLLTDIRKTLTIASKEMLTSEETCDVLGISLSYLHHLMSDGEITYYQRKAGAKVYFSKDDIYKFMRQGEHASSADMDILNNTIQFLKTNQL